MQNKNSAYSELTFINEENEPCLRTLKKRIRNSIKKLEDIKQLQTKEFLQPEQLEKINRKQKFISERDKYVDFVVVYRQILIQNQQHYLKQQYDQVDRLANAFTSLAYKDPQEKDLLDLKKLMVQQNPNQSWKVKKAKNAEIIKKFLSNQSANSKIIENLSENKKKNKPVKEELKIEVSQEKKENISITKDEISELGRESIEKIQTSKSTIEKKVQKKEEKVHQVSKSEISEKKKEQNKGQEREKRERKYRKPRKPKYDEKNDHQNSKEEVEGELRYFKKQEIKSLEDDGFIVVGKPKPKARDQKKWHDHQHGRRFNRKQQKQK